MQFLLYFRSAADQQPNLSQLANLAGTQNSVPPMGQVPAANGMNLTNLTPAGMGVTMNDNPGEGLSNGMAPFYSG